MIKKSIIGIVFLLGSIAGYAQTDQLAIIKKIAVKDSLVLDSLSIIPNTLKITEGFLIIDKKNYQINYASTLLLWKNKPKADSVTVQYQTFPILFSKKQFNKDPKIIEEVVIGKNPFTYSAPKEEGSIFGFEGFQKSGSISRGIGFGNNQNLAVNSNLVLQLSGKLNNDIEILAAISDDNIPIQPDGNTQQINDFDKVFIQLKRKGTTLIAGDYELRRPDSYFTNYYKRTQGALFSNDFKDKKGNQYSTAFAAAVAKGRSARNQFNGIEGNQGPYRLQGNNGEQFIIILSGTERVYIDGVLLLRGQENDYVMDYNTAELTFTSKRLITQNARIVVEFEYSDKVFARSLYNLNQGFKSKKIKIGFNYYSEQDNPNKPLLQSLNNQQKQFLSGIGNQINQAVFPNIDSVGFNGNEILYKKVDTLGAKAVYVYSTNPNQAKFRVGFTYVGPNAGNYSINTNAQANGRVYVFVPPINGVLQGDYAPVTLLVTPKKQQLITLNADYKIGKKTNIFSEIGFSDNDVNLYSDIGNSQNKGIAYKLIFEDQRNLKGNDSTGLKLKSSLSYEYVNQQFKPLERYRPVEFDRDFNLNGANLAAADEYWTTLNFKLYKNDLKQISYTFSNFNRGSSYNGIQQGLATAYQYKKYRLAYTGSLLNSKTNLLEGTYYKNNLAFSKIFKNTEAGLAYREENNQTNELAAGQLSLQSFAFREYEGFYKSADTAKNGFLLMFNQRFDDLPIAKKLNAFSKAETYTGKLIINKTANSNLAINASYRTLKYLNNDTLKQNEETLLGRVDYNFTALKGFINLQSFYELGTGQEPKREFVYLEVAAAQGIYSWNDYNKNGIKELNEFEVSKYPDQAKYIKIYIPNNQFVRSNFTNINQTLTLNPAIVLKNKKGKTAKFISKFSNISSLRIDKKVLAGNGILFNPYQTNIKESNLISLNSFIRNTVFYNRSNPVFGFDVSLQKLGSKLLLTNGFDSRNTEEQSLRIRWNFIRKSNFNVSFNKGIKDFSSQLFTERNYHINYLELQPEFGYQFNTNFKTTFLLDLKNQKNEIAFGGEKTFNTKIGSELRYNILKKGTVTAQFNFINNSFEGANNTSIAYELLEGLQPGKNLTWSAGFQRTIANGIQLNFTYEGRKSNDVKTIHTGGLQVRAYF
ncbi:hypothetical protein I5M32_00850 [Pedobacter sp. SD-b]|uniref:Uncharacterized protein n=1 Tax=Pedobacter segetis TaxID=2793069 RepID=A0ABS1BF73_9SPHI|nr:hypothetical protein [Pedobacter segetis]MBK0381493.1 hypothetical protein [Pedobacter segetis]